MQYPKILLETAWDPLENKCECVYVYALVWLELVTDLLQQALHQWSNVC